MPGRFRPAENRCQPDSRQVVGAPRQILGSCRETTKDEELQLEDYSRASGTLISSHRPVRLSDNLN